MSDKQTTLTRREWIDYGLMFAAILWGLLCGFGAGVYYSGHC